MSHRDQKVESRTLVAHFQLSYVSTKVDDAFPSLNSFQQTYRSAELRTSLHERVECALEKLFWTVLSGFPATPSDYQKYLLQYDADIPEAKYVLSMKSVNMNNTPCYRCQVSDDKFAQAKRCGRGSFAHTFELLWLLEPETSVNELNFPYSILSIRPALDSFRF